MISTPETQPLFDPFLDVTDMVTCCAADTALGQLNQHAAEHHLRFPLVCDASASLRQHLAAVEYASPSARFGPYVDNILGMNWELQSGNLVRIGERVIKSATGYDLLRFLLQSDGRYGRARDYVLRLRPRGGETARAAFSGAPPAIEQARRRLLNSPWLHWLDSVDLTLCAADLVSLELAADCAATEVPLFEDFFRAFSTACRIDLVSNLPERATILPPLSMKTTVSDASILARQLVRDHGGSARVLCVNGVVHYFPPPPLRSLPGAELTALNQRCISLGGHISGPWAPEMPPDDQEVAWADQLEARWNQL